MAKEVLDRKRSMFCGSLVKELRKRLVKCFVWSVALYGADLDTTSKNDWKHLRYRYGEEWNM